MQSSAMEQSSQLQQSCIDSPEAFTESYCGGPHRRATPEVACKILESVRSSGGGSEQASDGKRRGSMRDEGVGVLA